jgi:hypothetical protein
MLRKTAARTTIFIILTLFGTLTPATFGAACQTYLPSDLGLRSPPPNVPSKFAKFAGVWGNGTWEGKLCSTLVVQSVDADGRASVIYSRGTYRPWNIYRSNYVRVPIRITSGTLTFKTPMGAALAYQFSGTNSKAPTRGRAFPTLPSSGFRNSGHANREARTARPPADRVF